MRNHFPGILSSNTTAHPAVLRCRNIRLTAGLSLTGENDPHAMLGESWGFDWVHSAVSLCLQLQKWWGCQRGGNCTRTGAWAASCWVWDAVLKCQSQNQQGARARFPDVGTSVGWSWSLVSAPRLLLSWCWISIGSSGARANCTAEECC